MNQRKIKLITISILIILSSCYIVKSVENPINKGIVDYKDYEYITFTSPYEVNLSYITSEIPSSALTFIKTGYYPLVNETKYKFSSNTITPDHAFNATVKTFIYQDTSTGQLYLVSVDYTMVTIPLSPLEILYNNLLNNYSLLLNNYTDILMIKEVLDNINNTITTYLNTTGVNNTNVSLNTTIAEILSELTTSKNEYDIVKNNLDTMTTQYNDMSNKYTSAYNDKQKLEGKYANLLLDYNDLNTTYNATVTQMHNISGLLQQYMLFEDNINSMRTDFFFNNRYYKTFYYYEMQIQKLQDELGLMPIYIAIVIFFTILACYMYYRRIYGKRPLNSVEKDVDYNYPEEASLFDRFSMHKLFNKIKKKTKTVENPDVNPLSDYVDDNDESTPVETIIIPDEQNRVVTKEELDEKIGEIHKILDSLTAGTI